MNDEPTFEPIKGCIYFMQNCRATSGKRMPEWDGMRVRSLGNWDWEPLTDRPDGRRGRFRWEHVLDGGPLEFRLEVPLPDLASPDSVVDFLTNN
ncbi:hypothetical protein GCM10028801_31410 [Nocardioides maradonensis]